MRYSLFFDPLFDPRVFGEPSGGGGGGGGGSSSSDDDDKPAQKPTLTKADNTIGQVSKTGQYAGDGFEWVETTTSGGTQFLTRTYTGKGKDNGLGQDVRFGSTAQKDEKEAIAQISLNEGSAFAASPASATDIPANEIGIPTGFFPESDSYAEQVGQTDYKPTVKYIDSEQEPEPTPAPAPVDTTPDTSPRPQSRPEPEPVETGPAFDYTGVSMGELGRGAPEGTLPPGTFEYAGGVDPAMEVLSSIKATNPDELTTSEILQVNQYEREKAEASPATGTQVAAAETMTDESPDLTFTNPRIGYESGQDVLQSSPDYLTGLDGSGPNTVGGVSDAFYGGTGYDIEPAVAINQMQDAADNKSLLNIGTTDLLPGLAAQGGEQVVSGILETARDLNVPGSGADFVQDPMYKYRAAGLGDMSGLDRLTDEQYLFSTGDLSSQETGPAAMRLPNATTTVENVLQNIADKEFAEMQENIEKLSPETKDLVQSQAVTIPKKFGYGLDQVDPAFAGPLGEDPNKYNLSGIEVNPKAAGAQAILTSPAFLATLGTSFVNPYAGGTLGGTLAGGEGQRTINAEIDKALESGVLQNTKEYQDYLTALNASGDTAGLSQAEKDARIVGQLQNDASRGLIPLNFLAAGVSAITPGLLKSGRTGAVAAPFIEGGEEGALETALTNRALLGATSIEKKVDPSELASETLVGGLTATGPSVVSLVSPRKKADTDTDTDTKAFVPTSATAGQTATDPVGIQTEYEKAAGVDTTQMRPEIAPDRVTVAEMLMDQQLEDQGAIDVADLQDLGLTLFEMEAAAERATTNRMDKDAKMLRALVEDSVVNTGQISEELVQEMNAKLNPEIVARITNEAFNNPLVTKDGETRVDLGIQKAAIEDALRRPPSGIEQAMLPPVDVETSIPTIDRTAPKDNTAKEDSAVARAQEDQAVFDAANEALAESRREASLDQPTTKPKLNFDTNNPLAANISIGTTVGGLTEGDKAGNIELGRGSFNDLDPRREINIPFIDAEGKEVRLYRNTAGKIDTAAPYGEPVTRMISNKDGSTTIQVASRLQSGTRDDYASVQVTIPQQVVDPDGGEIQFDVLEEAQQLALDQWKQNYEGVMTAGTAKEKAGELSLSNELTQSPETAREASLDQPDSAPKPEATEEVSGIRQVAETKETTPKLSPFTEEGRKGIAALNTSPSKVNLSQTEEEVAVDTKPPSPFTEEGRAEIAAKTQTDQTAVETEQTPSAQTTVETEPTEGSTTVEVDKTASKVAASIDPPESPEDEDDAVEVEVDDVPETDTGTETDTTVEIDLPFVAPEVTTDADGNNTFECPDDSYTLVAGPDGPICKKNVQTTRMRAGRSLSPYTRLNIPEGYRGPGQKTKTTTRTETTEPIRA